MLPRSSSFVLGLVLSLGVVNGAAGEVSCLLPGDCDDGDACTGDLCVAGSCVHRAKSDCRACATAADCDDGNACTADACSASGRCEATVVAGCQLEVCGNCLDDDGDGLVDLADTACCAPDRTAAMTFDRGVIAPGAQTSRLRLEATLDGPVTLSEDGQQVLMQLGSAPGGTFCASIPPSAFRGTSRRLRLARSVVPGARGVRRMSLRAVDGGVAWRAGGRRVGFSTDEREGALDVFVLLADATDPARGARCFSSRPLFRPGRRGTLVAP